MKHISVRHCPAAELRDVANILGVGVGVAEEGLDRPDAPDTSGRDQLARPHPLRMGAHHEGLSDGDAGALLDFDQSLSLHPDAIDTILDAPGIARGADGAPLADPEFLMRLLSMEGFAAGSLQLRGVGPAGLALRPDFRIVAGHLFRAIGVVLGCEVAGHACRTRDAILDRRLDRDAAQRVLTKTFVENGVADLIANFIWVTVRN